MSVESHQSQSLDDSLPSTSPSMDSKDSSIEALPYSVTMSIDLMGCHSDAFSQPSDAPSSLEIDYDIDDDDQYFMKMDEELSAPWTDAALLRSRKRKAANHNPQDPSPEFVDDFDGSVQMDESDVAPLRKVRVIEKSAFENLPKEIINAVAVHLPTDSSLHSLILTCKAFAYALTPENSDVWRIRYLKIYDYPCIPINSPNDICVAYRLRRFTLSTLSQHCENSSNVKADVQLEGVKDMAIEAWKRHPNPCSPAPTASKNLASFASPDNSPWMVNLLSTPFYAPKTEPASKSKRNSNSVVVRNESSRYGTPHHLFDALQVTLSYLLLSPNSAMAHKVNSDRANYDLARVYCWDQPLKTLWRKVTPTDSRDEMDLDSPVVSATSRLGSDKRPYALIPNLRSPGSSKPPDKEERTKFELDMHTILHIRNFWHRHLIEGASGFGGETKGKSKYWDGNVNGLGEDTYATMARKLGRIEVLGEGRIPRAWGQPLHRFDPAEHTTNTEVTVAKKWFGHYSCMHPWPKKREELEERQSCAEDWNNVDPLMLDLTATTDETKGFWPPVFSTIPMLEDSVPERAWFGLSGQGQGPYIYFRGLASFVDLDDLAFTSSTGIGNHPVTNPKESTTITSTPKTPSSLHTTKYHPYASLRIRGLAHPLPTALPQTNQFHGCNQPELADIPDFHRIVMILYKPTTRYLIQVLERAMGDFGDPFLQMVPLFAQTGAIPGQLTPEQHEAALKGILAEKVKGAEEVVRKECKKNVVENTNTNMIWTPSLIARLEDDHVPLAHLAWDDVEYAYAYEGVITPGGRVMMGRWWRCASQAGGGMGAGMEVVEDPNDLGFGEEGHEIGGGLRERGPFCFWS